VLLLRILNLILIVLLFLRDQVRALGIITVVQQEARRLGVLLDIVLDFALIFVIIKVLEIVYLSVRVILFGTNALARLFERPAIQIHI
jgi:hypothetical protein